jgi:hypothetical protein
MSLVVFLVALLGGWFLGWLVGYTHNPGPRPKYSNPELHGGRWAGPELMGSECHPVAVWRSLDHDKHGGTPHVHRVLTCAIGPSLAHEDVCLCGAKRFGVFGSWS